MDLIKFETAAFVLMALALPLISYGSVSGSDPLWIAGFVVLIIGTTIPPVLRYVGPQATAA